MSHSLIAPSLLLCGKVYSLCLCPSVWDDTRLACFNAFNLFRGDGISVAAVSSEMALTGRSHSDNHNPPSISLPPLCCFLFPHILSHTRFFFLFFDFIPIFLQLLPTSPVFHLSFCLRLLSPLSVMYFWEYAPRDLLILDIRKNNIKNSWFLIWLYPHWSAALNQKQYHCVLAVVLPHTFLSFLYLQTHSLPPCLLALSLGH